MTHPGRVVVSHQSASSCSALLFGFVHCGCRARVLKGAIFDDKRKKKKKKEGNKKERKRENEKKKKTKRIKITKCGNDAVFS